MNILNQLYKWRFKIDRMSLRDRGMAFALTLLGIILLWYLTVYNLQSSSIKNYQASIKKELAIAKENDDKRMMIERLSSDNTVTKLLAKYQRLQEEMKGLDASLNRHKNRYVSDKELAAVLKSILEQTPGVKLIGFSNLGVADSTSSEDKYVFPNKTPNVKFKRAAGVNNTNEDIEHIRYKLVLQGTYFAIFEYLRHLEASKWQLYWDKLNYTVEIYPEAIAVIEFYTLRPSLNISLVHPGKIV